MDDPSRHPSSFRFAGFVFDARTGELRSQEQSLHLTDQAAAVLLALLQANGEMVSREELKRILWPDKTFGDLEGGLNTAVRKLRQALGDDGAEPSLIGTLPKRGYRLLVPLETVIPEEDLPEAPQPVKDDRTVSTRRPRMLLLAAIGMLALAGLIWLLYHRSATLPIGKAPGEIWKDGASGIEFVWIPAGTFLMGSPPDERGRNTDENQHQVTISKGFWLGRYELTQAQYEGVMGENPSKFKEAGPQAPVESVNWEDAQSFLRKLQQRAQGKRYRLPSEAEWEYACRGGSTASAYGPLGAIAWNAYTSGLRTHPVGQKDPNAWGLYDMLGNVYEWCQDCYKDPYDTSVDTDPVGPPSNHYHAIRGGSWQSGTTQSRAAFRASEEVFALRYPFTGFRVVCVTAAGNP